MTIQLDKWAISLVIFGLFIGASVLIMLDVQTNYDVPINETGNYTELQGALNQTYETSREMRDLLFGAEVDDSNFIGTLAKGSYLVFKQLKNTITIPLRVIEVVADTLDIHPIFVEAAIAALVLSVIIALAIIFIRLIPT